MIDIKSLPNDFQRAIQTIGPTPVTIDDELKITANLEDAISKADVNFAALSQAITILKRHNHHRHIIQLCERALEFFPNNITIHEYLHEHYDKIENEDKALEHLKHVLEITPLKENTKNYLINTYDQFIAYAQTFQKYDRVIWALEDKEAKPITLNAGDLINWADALQELRETDQAKEKYLNAATLNPDHPLPYIMLAEIKLKNRQFETALQHINTAQQTLDNPKWDKAKAKDTIQTIIDDFRQRYDDQQAFLEPPSA